ncbi:MAG: hypothetical protein U0R67_10685 [Micropruina glycogenica]
MGWLGSDAWLAMSVPFSAGSDADAAVVTVVGSVDGWGRLGVVLVCPHDAAGFASGHFVFLVDEVGDAVAEGVGGVFDGQRAERCGVGELPVEVGSASGEVGQVCGEGGQRGVAGARGGGVGDLGEPIADAGLAGLEGPLEAALGVVFGAAALVSCQVEALAIC